MTSRAPRILVELQNAIALVRETYVILDQQSLRSPDGEELTELADQAWDLLQALRAKLEEREVGTGYGWLVPQTIEIRNVEA